MSETPTINAHLEIATLAGGCFWCIESAFSQLKGITSTTSGYMGGSTIKPTYEEVCSGETGHAEVVQLAFERTMISYQEILEIFFTLHDPTQLNRQGNDVGTQYRSAIFYHNELQYAIAKKTLKTMRDEQVFKQEIVTHIGPVDVFYAGEDYHQNYFNTNPENQYCQAVVSPKLTKFRQTFINKLK